MVGVARMVMVKVWGAPSQPFRLGVTVILATWVVAGVPAVKEILPVPESLSPMFGLSLVQEKVAPAVPLNGTFTCAPPQNSTLKTWLIVGLGVTVMVKFWAVPVQPFRVGMTLMVPVWVVATLLAVKLMSPLPLPASPILVLVLVQVKSAPLFGLLKATSTGSPPHTVRLAGSSTVGRGLIVMVKVRARPAQAPRVGTTVMVATC